MTSQPISVTPSTFVRETAASRVTFFTTLRSEWSKLATLRSTHITLALGLLLSVATSALVCVALGSTQDEWSPDFNPVTTSMVGTVFGLIVYSVFGVMVASREYATGTIRLTLTATPNRTSVFAAKLMLVTAIILLLGLVTSLGMFFVSQAILEGYGMPSTTLSDPDAARMVLGLGVATAFFPVLGFAFGILLRSTAGGITTVLGLLWLPQIFGEFVPMWWRENVLSFLPSNGMDSLTVSHIQPSPAFSEPLVGALIVLAWLIGVIGTAYIAFLRRDA